MSSGNMDLRVYVSSTSIDLKGYRAAVISALRKMGATPVCMEDYVAQDKIPVEKCLADVARSEIYVGIFARRYGFIPRGHEKSITELEYRKAVECGIPTLIFLLDENVSWQDEFRDSGKDADRIKALRRELEEGKLVGYFKDPYHLASEVQSALSGFFVEKVMGQRYAEVSVATTFEQGESVKQSIVLLQELMRQQSRHAQSSAREPIPVNLPRLHGTFVDREVERDTLHHCLRGDDKRLVVVVAPGGYGKTELTTKVLKEVAPSTSITRDDIQGILYLKCVRADITLGQVFAEAGRIAGKKDEFKEVYASKELNPGKKLEYFFSELSKAGNVWIVMDNFEDLLDPKDDSICDMELREFIETAASVEHNIRMIITSRAVPKFKGNRKVEKIDLSAGLPEDQAILYLREEGADYGLGEEDEVVLREYVRRVHCIPKALESALGYLEDHYPAIKLSDLLKDKALFASFERHDLERGLKSLVAHQFGSLSSDAQLVLSVLSVFPKPAPLAALRFLLPAMETAEFAAMLSRLEKNRLISQNGGYYDLHPIVRSFVYERIPEGKATAEEGVDKKELTPTFSLLGLHAKAAEFYKELRKPKDEWKNIDDLDPQLQEIYHLIRAGQYDQAARVLGIIDFNYLQLWGHASVVIKMRAQLVGKLKNSDLVASNFGNLGHVYTDTGMVRESIPCYEKALEIERNNNDRHGISVWLCGLGNAYSNLGETRKAIEYYEQALAISRETGNRRGEGIYLGNLGNAYSNLGETRKAIEYHEQALAISRETGDRIGEGASLGNLGNAYSRLGETRKAIEYYEQALAISRETGYRIGEGNHLGNLGIAYSRLGETRKAIEYYEQALAISRETGDRRLEGVCLSCIGSEFQILGEIKIATDHLQESLSIARETGYRYGEGARLASLGWVFLELGEKEESEKHFAEALKIAKELESPDLISEILQCSAYAHHCYGQLSEARQMYEEALSFDVQATKSSCAALLGIALMEEGRPDEAKEYLDSGILWCRNDVESSQGYENLYNLGLALLALDKPEESREVYKRAIRACSSRGVVKRAFKDLSLLERAKQDVNGRDDIRSILSEAID